MQKKIQQTGIKRMKSKSLHLGHPGLFQCHLHLWLPWFTGFTLLIRAIKEHSLGCASASVKEFIRFNCWVVNHFSSLVGWVNGLLVM